MTFNNPTLEGLLRDFAEKIQHMDFLHSNQPIPAEYENPQDWKRDYWMAHTATTIWDFYYVVEVLWLYQEVEQEVIELIDGLMLRRVANGWLEQATQADVTQYKTMRNARLANLAYRTRLKVLVTHLHIGIGVAEQTPSGR